MSLGYGAVGWNRQKRIYDLTLLAGVVGFLAVFFVLGGIVDPNLTAETLLIRAFGAAAFTLLHVILAIGPLARLDARFLPLLYNRRHLGVTMFLLGLVHGGFSILQFHGFSDVDPLVSLFTSSARYDSLAWFPFQPLGFVALGILFLMAATSHDFWLANLGPRTWKTLHMGVYGAWALLVAHVALGALQTERGPLLPALVGLGAVTVIGLHLAAALREAAGDRPSPTADVGGTAWVDAGPALEIEDGRARVVTVGDERVAVFRNGERFSAVSNVCRHQQGPLGEGRILDGCITCPWHGYQYRPEDGCSPPPFTEKVETFDVRIVDGRVLVNPAAHPPGTPVEPATLAGGGAS